MSSVATRGAVAGGSGVWIVVAVTEDAYILHSPDRSVGDVSAPPQADTTITMTRTEQPLNRVKLLRILLVSIETAREYPKPVP
jgi:hypothetical protein